MSMTVADLQSYFADLARFVGKSGGKTLAADLDAVQACLTPFAGMTLANFAAFLAGKEPPPAGRRKLSGGGGRRVPAPDAAEVAAKMRQLYDSITDPGTTWAAVEEGLGLLQKLKKDDLVQVAEVMEIHGMSRKTKPQIIEAIRQRMDSRKGAQQRADMVNPLPV
jgi:hypothetical protein